MIMDEALTGHIIVAARTIEAALKNRGADGTGLHELTISISEKLQPETLRKLHFIAAVRNKAAHGHQLESPLDIAGFDEAVDEVLCDIEKIPSSAGGVRLNVAVDELHDEFKAKIRKKLRLLGALPLVNLIYAMALTVRGFMPGFPSFFLLLLGIIGITAFCRGLIEKNNLLIFIGGGFFVLHYVLTFFFALQHKQKYKIKWFYYTLPGLGLYYNLKIFIKEINYIEIFSGVVPMAIYAAAGYYVTLRNFKYAAIGVGVNYLWLLTVMILRRKELF